MKRATATSTFGAAGMTERSIASILRDTALLPGNLSTSWAGHICYEMQFLFCVFLFWSNYIEGHPPHSGRGLRISFDHPGIFSYATEISVTSTFFTTSLGWVAGTSATNRTPATRGSVNWCFVSKSPRQRRSNNYSRANIAATSKEESQRRYASPPLFFTLRLLKKRQEKKSGNVAGQFAPTMAS